MAEESTNVSTPTAGIADEIDKDTLVSLLKEKGKEIKTLENKNKKLEERYVKVFRENKNISKDKETLEKLLMIVFDRDQNKFSNVEPGTYDLTALTDLWNKRQDEKIRLFNATLESHKDEKRDLEKRLAALEEDLQKVQNKPEIEKAVEKHKLRISELENVNQKLLKEIKELTEVIEEKTQEINKLANSENEIDSLKAELLMKELQIKNIYEESNMKGKMQESERKNEVLRLRQELEATQGRLKDFETEKLSKANNLRTQFVQTEPMMNPFVREISDSPEKNSSPSHSILRQDSETYLASFTENGQVNQEYLKNVILKLFCYIEGNNLKEAKILMNAIGIILKMTPEDREKIEEARRNNSLWSNTVHFIKDTFSTKGDVNYYTSGTSGSGTETK